MELENKMHENIIWSMENCPECEKIENLFKRKNISYKKCNCKDLVNGNSSHLAAIRFFVKNKQTAPIISYDGVLYDSQTILNVVK